MASEESMGTPWPAFIADLLKKPSLRVLIVIAITSGLTLYLMRFGWFADVTRAVLPYKGWLIISLLVSSVWIGTYAVETIGKGIKAWITREREKQATTRHLATLTTEEKHALQPFIERQSRTLKRKIGDRVLTGLLQDRILIPSNSDGTTLIYRVADFVWGYLHKHPEVIATPNNPRPRATDRDWMT